MKTQQHPVSANRYIALTGIIGMVLWFLTQAVIFRWTFEVTPLFGATGLVIAVWVVYTVGSRLVGVVVADNRVWLSSPFVVWFLVSAFALIANGVGVIAGDTTTGRLLMWLPWGLAFVVGYLGTWALVNRGGIYFLAAVGSVVFVAAGVTVGVAGLHFAILGLLHGVPTIVDAARGGRELTADGTPALRVSNSG
jgi:hypothetical protein